MRKLQIVFAIILFTILSAGSAFAMPYTFEDRIDTWENDAEYAWIPSFESSYGFQHDINDEVDFAAGHMVTEASLKLNFDYLVGSEIFSTDVTAQFTGQEWAFIRFEDNVSGTFTPIEGDMANFDIAIDWLNDDGLLDVSLSVWGQGIEGRYLDSSVLSGTATDTAPVPEPATMLLLGTGLVGMAGLGRKKFRK